MPRPNQCHPVRRGRAVEESDLNLPKGTVFRWQQREKSGTTNPHPSERTWRLAPNGQLAESVTSTKRGLATVILRSMQVFKSMEEANACTAMRLTEKRQRANVGGYLSSLSGSRRFAMAYSGDADSCLHPSRPLYLFKELILCRD